MSNPLQFQAAAELELRRRYRSNLPTVDLVPEIESQWHKPSHLAPYTSILELADTQRVNITASAPPRHSKTETTLAYCVRRLLRQPSARIAYVSYGIEIAWEKSRRAFAMAEAAGVHLRGGKQRAGRWETTQGGSFFAAGLSGTFTGKGFDILIIDDPHKDRADAESALKRRRVYEWFTGTARTRLQPGGSTVVTHTRWHLDDLIGKLQAEDKKRPEGHKRWRDISLPAVKPDGTALWPEFWPLSELEERRESEYDWWSLYMCSPRPRGTAVFQDVHFYSELPSRRIRYAIGVDLAFTESTHADYSVAVVLAECEGVYYVVDVLRKQVQAPEFATHLQRLVDRYKGAKVWAYAYGPELGSVSFIKKLVPRLHARQPKGGGDKLVRSGPVSAAWNGTPESTSKPPRVLVPGNPGPYHDAEYDADDVEKTPDVRARLERGSNPYPWVSDFITELQSFTGLNDPHDDQVDALAAAYDALQRGSGPATASAFGGSRTVDFEDRPML